MHNSLSQIYSALITKSHGLVVDIGFEIRRFRAHMSNEYPIIGSILELRKV